MKRNHLIWMIIGCIVPLLLIFLAPALGLSSNYTLLIFILAMFASHLLIPHGHGGHGEHGHNENKESNTSQIESHERHQH